MSLASLSEDLSTKFVERARRFKLASHFVSLFLVVGAALVAGVAQFAEFPPEGPSAWQMAGIAATIVTAIGAVFTAFVGEDPAEELALARKAVEEARSAQEQLSFLDEMAGTVGRSIELYQAMNLMRGAIEQSTNTASISEGDMVSAVLAVADRALPIAMGFAQADQWTICIYRADLEPSGKQVLRCVAHHRAISCNLDQARVWDAGTGIAGAAFSNGDEVLIPDLQSPGLRAIFGTAANTVKEHDADRYRSMAASPVMVAGTKEPWGVVTATNDRVDHFSSEQSFGAQAAEGVRALSSMVALAVAVHRTRAP